MALEAGAKLGPYEILSPLGAGGMGEVYKAKDTRLDRTVAIKVLPSHLSDNARLKERFEREARAVSSLNHPHICTLHDIGSENGVDFMVMEHIEGETLADRLKKGALPLDQALRHAIEIADALDKANRQGVVHRDLKPGNIMLTKSGAKLLDFGLATRVRQGSGEAAGGESSLLTEQKPLTEEGSILGTFQYMAPEQLEGKEADNRTDIFAFGALLHEMITGKRAFEGKSQASLIGAILKDDPRPMSELQPVSPMTLDRAVKKCLAKDPDDRWQSARDLTDELRWVVEGSAQTGLTTDVGKRQTKHFRSVAALVGLLAAFSIGFLAKTYWPASPEGSRVTRLTMTPSPSESFEITHQASNLTLSPDGGNLVYVGQGENARQLYHRGLDQLEAKPIPGTEGAHSPFFSPDGEWVGFFTADKLKKISLQDGISPTICDVLSALGGSWAADNSIIFSAGLGSGLMRVSADGGIAETLTTPVPPAEIGHATPHILPGGKNVLFSILIGGDSRIGLLSLETLDWHGLELGSAASASYLASGHLLYGRSGVGLLAVRFDLSRLEPAGAPVPVVEDVSHDPGLGIFDYSVSETGTLVYLPRRANRIVWVDRKGETAPLLETPRTYLAPKLSPDADRLAVALLDESSARRDIWLQDLTRGTFTRLTFEETTATDPTWAPDGGSIAYGATKVGQMNIFVRSVGGASDAIQLTASELNTVPSSWSPDGKMLFFHRVRAGTGRDIGVVRVDEPESAEILLGEPFEEFQAMLSPNGRWLAYTSDESGRREVYVRPFPALDRKWQVSTEGGAEPRWASDGREFFYRSGTRMMVVAIDVELDFSATKPTLLFEGHYAVDPFGADAFNYDVTPDGERFVMIREDEVGQLHVVLNWFEELKRLVPTN